METYRALAMKGAEFVLIGYNTPPQLPDWPEQNEVRARISPSDCDAGGCLPKRAVDRRGEQGWQRRRRNAARYSCIVAPTGEVVISSLTLADELICYRADMELAAHYKSFFDLERYRHPAENACSRTVRPGRSGGAAPKRTLRDPGR
jgi:hypothetical protein